MLATCWGIDISILFKLGENARSSIQINDSTADTCYDLLSQKGKETPNHVSFVTQYGKLSWASYVLVKQPVSSVSAGVPVPAYIPGVTLWLQVKFDVHWQAVHYRSNTWVISLLINGLGEEASTEAVGHRLVFILMLLLHQAGLLPVGAKVVAEWWQPLSPVLNTLPQKCEPWPSALL